MAGATPPAALSSRQAPKGETANANEQEKPLRCAQRVFTWLVLLTFGLMLSSCLPQPSRLRITNQSACPLHNLIVFFPRDRIRFGDVPAGATTGYQVVPNGVFACTAYELDVEGQILAQPVIDWVGAASLPGKAFTY